MANYDVTTYSTGIKASIEEAAETLEAYLETLDENIRIIKSGVEAIGRDRQQAVGWCVHDTSTSTTTTQYGDQKITGNLDVDGDAEVGGDLTVTGSVSAGSMETAELENPDHILTLNGLAGIYFRYNGTTRAILSDTSFGASSGNRPNLLLNANTSATAPGYRWLADADTGMGSAGADQLSLIAGAVEALRLTENTATTLQVLGCAVPTANANGKLVFPDCADGDPTMAANTACIYAKDNGGTTEMRVCDEAGNAQDISPHTNFAPAWMYDDAELGIMCSITESIQYYTGKVVYEAHSREKYLAGLTSAERDALPPDKRKCIHIETFAEHEARTGRKLVKRDWNEVQEVQRLRRDQEIADALAEQAKIDAQIADAKDEKVVADLTAQKEAVAVPEVYTKKPAPTRIAALTAKVIKEPIKQLP